MSVVIRQIGARGYGQAYEAILQFLAEQEPFAGYNLKSIVRAVTFQLRHEAHLVALQDNKLVGYLGWLWTSEEIAKNWLENAGKLTGQPDAPTAIAVSILAVKSNALLLPLMKEAKKNSRNLPVYWKRHFKDDRGLVGRLVEKSPV